MHCKMMEMKQSSNQRKTFLEIVFLLLEIVAYMKKNRYLCNLKGGDMESLTIIILFALLVAYAAIGTSHLTKVNKAAVAMFVCTLGWVVYISYGTDFVMSRHPREYIDFLSEPSSAGNTVKHFIYDSVFLKYVGKAATIAVFLIATMAIADILKSNGCFDFITVWVRKRNSRKLLWMITIVTFAISSNLDTLTTTTMMLVIMRSIVSNRRQRLIIGSAIFIAATAGGCFTVIGDTTGLLLWGAGAVTATDFSLYLILPAIIAFAVPTYLLGRSLPSSLDIDSYVMPYRGDDTNLNLWQRCVMLLLGIGGLWFIPTFHSITNLGPFLGAMCVLAVLWIVNEIFNRKLLAADQMVYRKVPRATQYVANQMILFVMAVVLGMGVIQESGAFSLMSDWVDYNVHNVWITGLIAGAMSSVVDPFLMAVTNASMYPVLDESGLSLWMDGEYMANFIQNGAFWKIMAFATAIGSCLFCFANISGLALMKMEGMSIGWYFKNVTLKVLVGLLLGYAVLWGEFYVMG